MISLTSLRNILRRISAILLPPILILIALALLAIQFREVASRNEILSLSSFIVLISFSALAFNWCRVSPTFTSEITLKVVYQAGIDLFLASLLALVATFFAWLQTAASLLPTSLAPLLFAIHWFFLFLAFVLFLIAILILLKASRQAIPVDQ